MARFSYIAEKSDGELYRGIAQARDRFELYEIIRREGGRLISFDEDEHSLFSVKRLNEQFSTIKEYDKILFARNLSAMLTAGLSLARALAVFERQAKNARLARTVEEIATDVRHGSSFYGAMQKFPKVFPNLFVAMVRAGEEGGELPQSLSVVADQMERMHTLKKKIRGALIYPIIIICAIVGIGALMMVEVVPTLAKTFIEMGAQLPLSTRVIIGISDFLVTYTIVAIGGLVALIVGLYAAFKSPQGKRAIDFMFVRMPIIGAMVREVNAARTARTLASLLSAGVDMLAALSIASEVVQNSYFRAVLTKASADVAQGQKLSSVFVRRSDLYPAFVGEMVAVGEETGQLSEMLKRVAVFYEDEVDRKTKDLSTIIEPLLMVVIGAAVGFFAVSMISPIYQLSSNI